MRSFLIAFLMLASVSFCIAQKLPSQKAVLQTLQLTNSYFMNKWSDPAKEIFVPSRNRTWPSHIWTRAVYYECLMELYGIDPQKKYYDYAVDWSEKHHWGLRSGIETRNGDNQACG